MLQGDDEFKTALSGGETYHIPEPEWHPDTVRSKKPSRVQSLTSQVFFIFAYLQTQAADPYGYEKLLQQNEEIKKMVFAGKRRAKVKTRSTNLYEPRPKMEEKDVGLDLKDAIVYFCSLIWSVALLV